ncbi:hypothetical protein NQ318_002116 [Aromia moschata]|uniref:Uncharacterized protein n=1 Tax=Aromia moschata TaxID=1265417 RepID=A0AAV8XZ68_9CUCU|nr:hypothetical protein NQ318_002116 [Aromia moschata]
MVPKLLIPEQKESIMNICADILNNIDTDPGLLDTVITCDDKIRNMSLVPEILQNCNSKRFAGEIVL